MAALGCVALATTLSAQDMPADYQQVLSTLGRQGDFKAGVLKVNVPRSDLSVTVAEEEMIPENLSTLSKMVAFVQRKQHASS